MKKAKTAKAKKTTAKAKKSTPKKTQGAKAGSKKDPMKKKTVKSKESTHIIAILDRSGSMSSVALDAIGGFNTFLGEQKKLKDNATMSVLLFDDRYEHLFEGRKNVKEVPELTTVTFVPRGMTALYQAIGKSITEYKASIAGKNVTEKILVLIVTDGHDNVKGEFSKQDIADMIKYQKTQNWEFMFLCSTEDAVTIGAELGVAGGNTFKFDNSAIGNKKLYKKLSLASANYRGMTMDYLASDEGSLRSANLLADVKDED